MIDAERRLWALLRRKELARFWRQVQIGPYDVDLFRPRVRLMVEVDGAFHGDKEQSEGAETRTCWLQAHSCRVVRLWNKHVFMYPDRVVDTTSAELSAHLRSRSHSRAVETPPQGGKVNGIGRDDRFRAPLLQRFP